MYNFSKNAAVAAIAALFAFGVPGANSPAEAQDWTGFYLGGHLGWTGADFDANVQTTGFSYGLEPSGVSGGVFGGYNFQSGNIVYGLEGDLTFGPGDDSATIGTASVNLDHDVSGTIRGRVGAAFNQALLYATAGVAFGNADLSLVDPSVGLSVSESNTLTGYVVGAGVDYMISPGFIARAEYLFTDYGDETFLSGTPAVSAQDGDLTSHTVRAGVAVKF